jgi:phage shock protein E
MGLLDLLGFGKKTEQIKNFIDRKAIVLDVRSSKEFNSGHVKGAQNVPLNSIKHNIEKIKKLNKPVITCCASGMRSASAASILKQHGIEAINGGSWTKVDSLVQIR